jgi:hypothetical protein
MVVAAVLAVIAVLGAGTGYVMMKLNRPDRIWVPLLVNPDLPEEMREEAAGQISERLLEQERMVRVVREMNLEGRFGSSSQEAAVEELRERIFVSLGEAETPVGAAPAFLIGVSGKRRERTMLGEVTMRLMEDVKEILELPKPEAESEF